MVNIQATMRNRVRVAVEMAKGEFPLARKLLGKLLIALIYCVLLCDLSTFPSMAQNHLSLVSDFARVGRPASAECLDEGVHFLKLLTVYPHPASGWEFVVICDDITWLHVMRKLGMADDLGEHYGETDIEHNLTLIRGVKLIRPDMGVSPEHIVTHELAHVVLHSTDEAKVDRQAFAWMAKRRQTAANSGKSALQCSLLCCPALQSIH
jgi:hypothetical protein